MATQGQPINTGIKALAELLKERPPKVAVITPYYKEPIDQMERCLLSVRQQTVAADHFLISDGHPQSWLDLTGVRHIRLGKSHGDYGNTPRGIGAQLAISEDYDAICFLDADNWYDKDHVQVCLQAALSLTGQLQDCDYVVAKRRLVRPDLTVMYEGPDEPGHIDTNSLFMLRGAFHLIPYWNLMPQNYSSIGDRLFRLVLLKNNLKEVTTNQITVNYYNLWASSYRNRGEQIPDGAKQNVNVQPILNAHHKLEGREKILSERRLGLSISKNKI